MRVPKTVAEGVLYGRRFAQRLMAMDDGNDLSNPEPPGADPVQPLVEWCTTNLKPDDLELLIRHLHGFALSGGEMNDQNPTAQAIGRGPRAPEMRDLEPDDYRLSMKSGASPVDLIVHFFALNLLPEQQEQVVEGLKQHAERNSMAGDAALRGFNARFPDAARLGHRDMISVANREPAPPLPLSGAMPRGSFAKRFPDIARVQIIPPNHVDAPPPHSRSRNAIAQDAASADGFLKRFPDAARLGIVSGRAS
jgi:hypothetical protein